MANLVRTEPSLFRADEAWFIFDDGRQCLRKTTPPEPRNRAPMIGRDSIDPCRGPDGRMHDSLASYRKSLRADGNPQGQTYTEIGNERLTPVEHKFDRQQRREDIRAGLEDVRNGRVPPLVTLED